MREAGIASLQQSVTHHLPVISLCFAAVVQTSPLICLAPHCALLLCNWVASLAAHHVSLATP